MTRPKAIAEFVGTFALIFVGTGAMIVDVTSHGALTHVGVAITWGLAVMALIYALGDVSGAHFNPAVTLGFSLSGSFPRREIVPYIACQLAGALTASVLLRVIFGNVASLGASLPRGSEGQSFVMEIVLSFLLMFIILSVARGSNEQGLMAGIAVGATIGLEAMFAGPVCDASMNPARSLAPALVSGNLSSVWLYLAGPVLGAAIAVPVWRGMKPAHEEPS